jgi:hypothetical protein
LAGQLLLVRPDGYLASRAVNDPGIAEGYLRRLFSGRREPLSGLGRIYA